MEGNKHTHTHTHAHTHTHTHTHTLCNLVNFAHTFLTDCCTNRACIFSNNESFIFYCNNSTSFESVICMKTVKRRLFKKYLKGRKSLVRFCLPLGCLHISEKKLLKTSFLMVQELIKQGKVVSFWPKFDPNFTYIWRA